MLVNGRDGELLQNVIEQSRRCGQRLSQGLKGRLTLSQGFAVAHKLKATVCRIAHQIG